MQKVLLIKLLQLSLTAPSIHQEVQPPHGLQPTLQGSQVPASSHGKVRTHGGAGGGGGGGFVDGSRDYDGADDHERKLKLKEII